MGFLSHLGRMDFADGKNISRADKYEKGEAGAGESNFRPPSEYQERVKFGF